MLIHANFGAFLVPLLWAPFQKLKRTSKVQSKLESKVTLLDPSFAILFAFLWHFFCAVSVPNDTISSDDDDEGMLEEAVEAWLSELDDD